MTSSSLQLQFFFLFFFVFFCKIAKYGCAKFHVKNIFLSGFMLGGHYVPPWEMIRQKYPEAERVKDLTLYWSWKFRIDATYMFFCRTVSKIPVLTTFDAWGNLFFSLNTRIHYLSSGLQFRSVVAMLRKNFEQNIRRFRSF